MSNHKQVTQKLEARLIDNWPHDYPCQLDSGRWANEDGDFEQPNDQIWVDFKVSHGAAAYESNCGGVIKSRRTGIITMYVYTPKETASHHSYEPAVCYSQIFENKTLVADQNTKVDIYLEQLSVIESAPVSNWSAIRLVIPFYFYD